MSTTAIGMLPKCRLASSSMSLISLTGGEVPMDKIQSSVAWLSGLLSSLDGSLCTNGN
jgi:hypothetical protein